MVIRYFNCSLQSNKNVFLTFLSISDVRNHIKYIKINIFYIPKDIINLMLQQNNPGNESQYFSFPQVKVRVVVILFFGYFSLCDSDILISKIL